MPASDVAGSMGGASSRAWYGASIPDFLAESDDSIVGRLAGRSEFDIQLAQQEAWRAEIAILRRALEGLFGHLFPEFAIPRMGRRVDAVVLLPRIILVIEFKVGSTTFDRAARDQVWAERTHGASLVAPGRYVVGVIGASGSVVTALAGSVRFCGLPHPRDRAPRPFPAFVPSRFGLRFRFGAGTVAGSPGSSVFCRGMVARLTGCSQTGPNRPRAVRLATSSLMNGMRNAPPLTAAKRSRGMFS